MHTVSDGEAVTQNRILKVAQVVGKPHGGVMSCVMNYYRNIDRSKVQFDFFFYGPGVYDDEIRSLGGRIFYFPNIFRYNKTKRVLTKLFKQQGYDIVHAHLTTRSGVALAAAKKAGVPMRICHSHSMSHPSEKLGYVVKNILKPYARKNATHYAGCCNASNRWLYGKEGSQKAFLMKNAVDAQKFVPVKKSQSDVKTIGFVGRFVFQKNLFFLLKVFRELQKIRTDVKLVLVGEGKDKQKLQKKAKKLGSAVEFRPPTFEVQTQYADFDVFVMTSRFEGLPLVAVEAQACGASCLLSDEISREADIGGRVEFLPLGNAALWAKKLNELLNENQRRAVNLYECGYDIKQAAEELLAFYMQS